MKAGSIKSPNSSTQLNRLRCECGLTYREVSEAIDVSKSIVSLWMLGTKAPKGENIKKLAVLFGVSLEAMNKIIAEDFPDITIVSRHTPHISEENTLSAPIFKYSIHKNTPYNWSDFFYIPSQMKDTIYECINEELKKTGVLTSNGVSLCIYTCISPAFDLQELPATPKFAEMSLNDQFKYIFNRLIDAKIDAFNVCRYITYLSNVAANRLSDGYLKAALHMLYNANLDFDKYSAVHNAVQSIITDIKENKI